MALYLEEFLYRGRPDGQPPAYHVVLGDAGTDAFGNPSLVLSGPLTPAQAEALGFSLQAVAEAINSQTLAALTQAQSDLDAARTKIAALEQQLSRTS